MTCDRPKISCVTGRVWDQMRYIFSLHGADESQCNKDETTVHSATSLTSIRCRTLAGVIL